MPARKKSAPSQFFYVYTMFYLNAEVKARVEAGGHAEVGEIVADLKPLARTEYQAAQALFRACRAARRNPLSYEVLVEQGAEKIIDVTIKH
jgi:hypothetical protein